MPPELAVQRSRQLLILALIGLLLASLWATRTSSSPNADRYDYLGRAQHVLEGVGPRPLIVYPLRMVYAGAYELPPINITRPPLWPLLVAPWLRLGLGDDSGVVMASVLLLFLVLMLHGVTEKSFGRGAGGMAAVVMVTSFATVRGLWGAGPELALALATYTLWTWSPASSGRAGYVICGAIYGLLPLLHPVGWLLAGLAFVARDHRYSPIGRLWVLAAALVVAVPWYVSIGRLMHSWAVPLQAHAELAKSLHDPAGFAPYRGLVPTSTLAIFQHESLSVLRLLIHRLKEAVLHLDGWLAWPLVALGLYGMVQDFRLALRDLILLTVGFAVVGLVSPEPRLLLPLLPVAASWCGAGYVRLGERHRRLGAALPWAAVAALPWLLPMGLSGRPLSELEDMPHELRVPPRELLREIGGAGIAGTPMFTDSAVLAWRSRRPAVFLPRSPSVLSRLRAFPALRRADLLVLSRGAHSRWTRDAQASWDSLIARSEILYRGRNDFLLIRLPSPASDDDQQTNVRPGIYVPQALRLSAEDVPANLVEIPVPPATRNGLRLRADAWKGLRKLLDAARADGLELRVVSAYRPWSYQKELYDRAIETHGPSQRWVAAPGASEHQLGSTVDLADHDLHHVLEQSFAETPEGRWLRAHAADFGFVVSYTPENEARSGYRPEPWHIRFLGREQRP